VGFYRQFLNTAEWGHFMQAGRLDARRALLAAHGAHDAHAGHAGHAHAGHAARHPKSQVA